MKIIDNRGYRHRTGLGAAAGVLGALLVPLAATPGAQAEPFFPEPPCIVTGTGLCVPDTVWPIHGGGGPIHTLPPIGHHPAPPTITGPPEVITCIVNEGCFTHPAGGPIAGLPAEAGGHDGALAPPLDGHELPAISGDELLGGAPPVDLPSF